MHRWDIIVGLTSARLKVRYRDSWLGLLWVLFQPVSLFAIQLLVFRYLLSVSQHEYSFFLATGFFPWFFIQQSVLMGTGTFLCYGRLIQSLTIHPMSYIAAATIDTAISFIVSFAVIILALVFLSKPLSWLSVVEMMAGSVPLIMSGFFIVWFCATIQVFLRDTVFIMAFALNLFFVATPILYPAELLPEQYRLWLEWNPISLLIAPFRVAVQEHAPHTFLPALVRSFMVVAALGAPTALLWRRVRHALIARL